eukprot:10403802-Karenia_brevis.AAC.1
MCIRDRLATRSHEEGASNQKPGGGSQKSEARRREPESRSQEEGTRGQKLGGGSQKEEASNKERLL